MHSIVRDYAKEQETAVESVHPESIMEKSYERLAHFSTEHEMLRREVDKGLFDLYVVYSAEHKQRFNSTNGTASSLFQALIASSKKLAEVDGGRAWRDARLKELSNLMQKRLEALQNPVDCTKARKLVCNLDKDCGFGCQIHYLTYCLMIAYGTERTMVMKQSVKNPSHSSKNFLSPLLSLSESCTDIPLVSLQL